MRIGVYRSDVHLVDYVYTKVWYIHNYVYVSGVHPNVLRNDLGCMKVVHA